MRADVGYYRGVNRNSNMEMQIIHKKWKATNANILYIQNVKNRHQV